MTIRLQPPFSKAQLLALHAVDYDFVYKHYRKELELALNPPAPIPASSLFQQSNLKKLALGEEVAGEFLEFVKQKRLTHADGQIADYAYDKFMKQKIEAQKLKDAEAEVEKWLEKHVEFIPSEANRTAILNRLQELSLPVTYSNLDQVFAALVASGDVTVKPPDSDWQSGAWRNGVWVPDRTGAAQRRNVDPSRAASEEKKVTKRVSQMSAHEFLSNLNDSPSFKQKVDSA